MATTTNFGWETPDDTDLVKDGALAMRTLGNSIDSSFVDLKGGTTGQVLAKASNTDLDYTWVTQDDANAIQNAIVDAKGDLIAASAADTPARLAVGNNGETLVADSSASTGLRWSGATGQNPVINGGMDIWQRGTSVAVSGASSLTFAADRWGFFRTGYATGMTVSRQVTGDTTNLPNIQYCQRVQRDSGNTSTANTYIAYNMETVNSIPYAGKTITFSFYARAGANFSAASNSLNVLVSTGTGTDQNILNGYTGNASPINSPATLTTTWQRFSFTATLSASLTQIGWALYYTPVGTAGANDYFEITGVQIDLGSVALPFRRAGGTLAGELAACQRYYWRTSNIDAFGTMGTGVVDTTTNAQIYYPLKVTMRVKPTSVDFSTLRIFDGAASYAVTAVAINTNHNGSDYAAINCTSSGMTAGRIPAILQGNGSTSAFLGFSAEL